MSDAIPPALHPDGWTAYRGGEVIEFPSIFSDDGFDTLLCSGFTARYGKASGGEAPGVDFEADSSPHRICVSYVPAVIAMLNDALPDAAELKITQDDAETIDIVARSMTGRLWPATIADRQETGARLARLAAKIAALLPPEAHRA